MDTSLTVNNIVSEKMKSNAKVSIILKSRGIESEKVDVIEDNQHFTKEYLDEIASANKIGPVYNEGESLINKLYELINTVANQNAMRISTSVLNQVLNEAIAIVQPPTDKGKRLKIFYMTQASTKPPTFVVFVNDKQLFHFSYERYLINQLRKEFVLTGTPIRMIVREKYDE